MDYRYIIVGEVIEEDELEKRLKNYIMINGNLEKRYIIGEYIPGTKHVYTVVDKIINDLDEFYDSIVSATLEYENKLIPYNLKIDLIHKNHEFYRNVYENRKIGNISYFKNHGVDVKDTLCNKIIFGGSGLLLSAGAWTEVMPSIIAVDSKREFIFRFTEHEIGLLSEMLVDECIIAPGLAFVEEDPYYLYAGLSYIELKILDILKSARLYKKGDCIYDIYDVSKEDVIRGIFDKYLTSIKGDYIYIEVYRRAKTYDVSSVKFIAKYNSEEPAIHSPRQNTIVDDLEWYGEEEAYMIYTNTILFNYIISNELKDYVIYRDWNVMMLKIPKKDRNPFTVMFLIMLRLFYFFDLKEAIDKFGNLKLNEKRLKKPSIAIDKFREFYTPYNIIDIKEIRKFISETWGW